MMIRIVLGLGVVFALTLGAYAQFPGETVPGIKDSQKATSKVGHKRSLKRSSEEKKVAPLPDEQTEHKLRLSRPPLRETPIETNVGSSRNAPAIWVKLILVGQRSESP